MTSSKYALWEAAETTYVAPGPAVELEEPRSPWEKAAIYATLFLGLQLALLALVGL